MRPAPRLALAVAALGLLMAATGCAAEPEAGDEVSGEVTVYAAASLGPAFEEVAAAFEDAHPGVDVRPLVLDGSQVLATQLAEGARADVFASADETTMDRVADLVIDPVVFATNTLVIATAPGNPGGIRSLDDLPGAVTVLCAPEVPCGAASARLLETAGVTLRPASLEQNVGAVLAKIVAGAADAGLVYRSDAQRQDAVAAGVGAIEPPGAAEVVNRYPIGALRDALNPSAAAAFADFVRGPEAQGILAEFGFGAA